MSVYETTNNGKSMDHYKINSPCLGCYKSPNPDTGARCKKLCVSFLKWRELQEINLKQGRNNGKGIN
jgi:hypothetical protein